jgi:hypothetical protein
MPGRDVRNHRPSKSAFSEGAQFVSDSMSVNERIVSHLKHAKELRKIAEVLSLRQARATVTQAAIEYEQLAESLRRSDH